MPDSLGGALACTLRRRRPLTSSSAPALTSDGPSACGAGQSKVGVSGSVIE